MTKAYGITFFEAFHNMHPDEFDSLFTDLEGTMFQEVVIARIKKVRGDELNEREKSLLKSYPMNVNDDDKKQMEKNSQVFKNDQRMAMKYFDKGRREKENAIWH